jgi:integrase
MKEAWIIDYRTNGSRHIETFVRKKDAEKRLAEVTVNVHKGVHVATSRSATVADAGKKWLADTAERLEAATVESYRQHFERHVVPYLGPVKLSVLTVPAVRDYMDRLRTDGRSPAMVQRVIGDLGSILADAQERGLVAQNVVRSLSHRKKKREAVRRQKRKLEVGIDIPSPAEIRAMVPHLRGRWRPLLLMAIFSGLRASELRGLQWSEVDFKKAEIHVRRRADKFNTMGAPKSAAGHRSVPMPPILVNTLREWKIACPPSTHGLVFPTGDGGVEALTNIVQRGLQPAQVAAGVVTKAGKAKYTGMHALRHFYASWCINRREDGGLGLPLKVVQHRLGHAGIQMTANVYGHLFPRDDDGAELAAAQKALLG